MAKKSILPLTLYRQFFDEITIGEKDKEYRKRKPHWKTRALRPSRETRQSPSRPSEFQKI